MIKVTFYGAAGEVTGSNHLIESEAAKYVVDCGLFQGGDSIAMHNDQPFAYNAAELKAIIITHAHLDHIGRLPILVKNGFRGPIYATAATIELTHITLKDTLHLMQREHERFADKPMLFEEADLTRTMAQFKAVPYETPQILFGKDTVTFYDAGHILGSASVLLAVEDKKIAFSGDIGYWPNTLLPQPVSPPEADLVVTEATYGSVRRQEKMDRIGTIKAAIDWMLQNKSVLLVPSFAVERSQELLFLLHHLFTQESLPHFPVYLDSPLAIEALEVFEHHKELLASAAKNESGDVFSFHNLILAPTGEDSREINNQAPPKMIIAGSGMMTGGRIDYHLKRYLPDAKNLLLVIGYQAEHTLGRRIVEGDKTVEIMGEWIPVRAKVEVVDIFSGHADDIELQEWLKKIHIRTGGRIAIVHSEPDRAETYRNEVANLLPNNEVIVAQLGHSVEL